MQRPYNERWERTKRYLFRNLLVDPGFRLSPVPEESRSDSSDDRPYSPLPELIVEREPNRHDDSQEFYQELEVRMRRYYRKLFLDDGSDADSVEYEEFDVNRSMASTFIIDINGRKDNEANKSTSDKHKADTESKENESDDVLLKEIHEFSKEKETPFKYEAYVVLDMDEDIRISNEEINRTVETESDLTQDNHRISVTVAEIHEEKKRSGPITRVFEDGSPILLPSLHKLSKHIFGALSADITENINYTNKGDVIEGSELQTNQGAGILNKSTEKDTSHNQAKEQRYIEPNVGQQNLDLEVTNSEGSSDAVTSLVQNLSQTNQVKDNTSSSDVEEEEIMQDDQSTTTNSGAESEVEEAFRDEESIGSNEYDYTPQPRMETSSSDEYCIENDDYSLDMALRRGIFERINKKKTFAQSSDEELASSSVSDSENRESVEVMRRAIQAESLTESSEALRRKSTMSQESPTVRAFTIPATEDFEEETSFLDKGQAVASAEIKDTQEDRDSVYNGITIQKSQFFHDTPLQISGDNIDLSKRIKNQSKASLKIKESIDGEDAVTTVPVNDYFTPLCHDIWSVSPIDIDVADILSISRNKDPKKDKRQAGTEVDLEAPAKKKKKYQSVQIQTTAREESYQGWEDMKTEFFVGTPLVFNLCSCHNHTCP